MTDQPNMVARNFSILPEQEAVLIQVAKDMGLGSVSAGLRYIITDWMRLKLPPQAVQALPSGAEAHGRG